MLSKPNSPHVNRVVSALEAPHLDTRLGVDADIAYSWRRCMFDFGLDPGRENRPNVIEAGALRERREQMDSVLEIARPELDNLFKQLSGSGSCLILTDRDGVIIDAQTEDRNRRSFEQGGLRLGADWSERTEGTNGIGTALSEARPVTVHLEDHFQSRHTSLTCSGAPLFGANGEAIGVLDVSTTSSRDSKQSQTATLALVNLTSLLVSNGLFMRQFSGQFVLRMHPNRQYLGRVCEGLVALSGEGRVLAANQCAAQLLQVDDRNALVGKPLDALFENDFAGLVRVADQTPGACFQLKLVKNSTLFFARLEAPSKIDIHKGARNSGKPAATPAEPRQVLSLAQLSHGDTGMCHIIKCARQVMNRDIPILIQGQTGSGKEALAKAIHYESDRRDEAFVAVNCASIPESLIESELFGYKGGAFTGARRDGMRGKLLQSSAGTLFLDEIGDMPLTLQTRLLRVLEDGLVYPLGSETPTPVDLHVIAATHQDLNAMVEVGEFRQDLYFRLNGISLEVPPLCEREDIRYLIQQLVDAEAETESVTIDPQVTDLLAAYAWPGNIRQMRNVIRVSLALCDHRHMAVEHLPIELRRENRNALTRALPMAPDNPPRGTDYALASAEKQTLICELERFKWNVSKTAQELGISRATLYRKMKRHGLDKG